MNRVLILILALLHSPLMAEDWVVNEPFSSIEITGSGLEYLEDPQGHMLWSEVQESNQWTHSKDAFPSLGYSNSTYWFRFTVSNGTSADIQSMVDVQYPVLSFVEFFVRNGQGELIKHTFNGSMIEFDKREVEHRHPLLPLNIPQGEKRSVYIKVQTESSFQVPITIWNERSFWYSSSKILSIQAIYFGVMIALALYNFFIFLSQRARSYLIYVCFVCCYSLFQVSLQGLGMEFLWPSSPWWNQRSLPFFIAASLFFASLFPIHFLKLRRHSIMLHRTLVGTAALSGTLVFASFIFPYSLIVRMGLGLSIPIAMLCIVAGIRSWRDSNPLGMYFSMAWSLFLIGTIMAALNKLGIIEKSLFTEFSQQIGSCTEVIMLSFALGHQMNLIRKEKFTAQKELLEAQENLNAVQRLANEQLELKVSERTFELNQKTANLNMMFQHLHQGILMIVDGCVIHHEYSTFMESIFERKDFSGTRAVDLLFADSNLSEDEIRQIESVLDFSLGSSIMTFEMNGLLLGREYHKRMPDGREKVLEIDWNPIFHDGYIERIMVTIRDVTEIREIKKYAEEQKRELDILGRIIQARPERFHSFAEKSSEYLAECSTILEQSGILSPQNHAVILRNLHTIKGNARVYGFDDLANLVHATEDTFTRQHTIGRAAELMEIAKIRSELEYCRSIFDRKLAKLANTQDAELVKGIRLRIVKLSERGANPELEDLRLFLESCSLDEALEDILLKIPDLSKKLNKPTPQIQIRSHGARVLNMYRPVLQDVFMHLFRNALDHGIETPEKRLQSGKNPAGLVVISLERNAGSLIILFKDDGKGLDLEKLAEKAHSKQTDWTEIAQCIFLPGVSTAEKLSEISGRGVGLDAARAFLREKGCDISVRLLDAIDKRALPFEFVIRMPLESSVPDLLSVGDSRR